MANDQLVIVLSVNFAIVGMLANGLVLSLTVSYELWVIMMLKNRFRVDGAFHCRLIEQFQW